MGNKDMSELAGVNLVKLDEQACEPGKPFGIITADCSDPCEIDDGIFVEPLPDAHETYRVGVCVADTSKVYEDRDVFTHAMTQTESRYYELPGGEKGHDPMIDMDIVRDLHFSAGNVRSALIISFVIGKQQPPTDVTISFGSVEVTANHDYLDFGAKCQRGEELARYGRASALILHHLRYKSWDENGPTYTASGDVNTIHREMITSAAHKEWLGGSRLNEAFMIGANHLAGRLVAPEPRPFVFRVHDPEDERYLELVPPSVALFSRTPGPHVGLGLNPYPRFTSPLRRLDDMANGYQARQRGLGRVVTARDEREIAAAVQQLNRREIYEVSKGPLRLTAQDVLGRRRRTQGGAVISPHAASSVRAIA
jgi:exoribonuclease R